MKGWILIVAGGLLQVPAVNAAHDLGYHVCVTDRNLDCACAGLADHFVELDTFDVEGHLVFINHWRHGFAAVFTAGADPIVTVAKCAEAAGCHGVPVNIARFCADKAWTRDALAVCLVPQPRYQLASDNLVSDIWCKPTIIKATSSSGSRGHTRIYSENTRAEVFEAIAKAQSFSKDGEVLLEQLLTGTELSVESLWYDGTFIPLNAVERPFLEGTNIELGHYNPWLGSADEYAAVWDVVEQAGRAVGMGDTKGGHIFKADLMYTEDGPKVLELTTRLSGGFDSAATTPLAHGADYTKGALLLALDRPLAEAMAYFMKRLHNYATAWAILGPRQGGIIKEIQGLDQARKHCDVVLRYAIGDMLPPLEDCAARVGFVIRSEKTQNRDRYRAKWCAENVKVICE